MQRFSAALGRRFLTRSAAAGCMVPLRDAGARSARHVVVLLDINSFIGRKEVSVLFQLDLKSRKSIYEQVIDNVKELIIAGVLPAESKLPSVRELSKTLTVNPNTVQKAYRELEHQGFIYTVTGLGCFVAAREEKQLDEKRVRQIMDELALAVKELMYLGVSAGEIIEKINEIYGERSVQS